jgi:hypothetical protein
MSLIRLVTVSCDTCYEESDAAGATGREARAAARAVGWRTGLPTRPSTGSGGRDECPRCRHASR